MEFKTQKDLENFVVTFINSANWQFVRDTLDDRQKVVLAALADPNTTPDGRAMLTGRLLEIEWMRQTPQNAAKFYETEMAMRQVAEQTSQEKLNLMKVQHPELFH